MRAGPGRRLVVKLAIAFVLGLRRAVGDDSAGRIALVELDAVTIEFEILLRDRLVELLADHRLEDPAVPGILDLDQGCNALGRLPGGGSRVRGADDFHLRW